MHAVCLQVLMLLWPLKELFPLSQKTQLGAFLFLQSLLHFQAASEQPLEGVGVMCLQQRWLLHLAPVSSVQEGDMHVF